MSKNTNSKLSMVPTGRNGDSKTYTLLPSGLTAAMDSSIHDSIMEEYGGDTAADFDDDEDTVNHVPIEVDGKTYEYVPWGPDDNMPYHIKQKLGDNMITSRCQEFNVTCCYGQGLRFVDRKEHKDVDDKEIRRFCMRSSLTEGFMQQATSIKYFFFSVTCIILSRDGTKIVQAFNKDAGHCRLEYAKSTRSGKIEHVFFGNWKNRQPDDKIEVIPLLDYYDPLGDLEVRMGREPDPQTGLPVKKPANDRKFAILCRIPTPGCGYYPKPGFYSIFLDAWLDIYRLIGIGKRYMIKNTSAPRIQIEVHNDYWDTVCNNENIVDPAKRAQRIKQEKQNIVDFCTGIKNAGKAFVSGYYIDPSGHECRMVRINNLSDPSKKEGGNWSDDMQEAANVLCFALGVHPNLVGATPGKSQMNNSGSDKRELFTLKQALEKPFHDVMTKPYHVILHYNGWADKCTVDVPMIMLTTLDENKDAKKVSGNANNNNSNNDGDNNQQE